MKSEARVKEVFPTMTISEKFTKIDFVAVIEGRFPKEVLFTLSGKSLDLADKLQAGELVEIEFDLSTRATKDGKYFGNSANVWKINALGGQYSGESYSQQTEAVSSDNLPF